MIINDYFYLAFAHLRHRQKRTLLTMIGIFIGIAAVVALISLGQGLQDSINKQFSTFGVDKIIIMPKSAMFSVPGTLTAAKITKEDVKLLTKTSGVMLAAGSIFKPVSAEFGNEKKVVYGMSLPEDAEEFELIRKTNQLNIFEGRMIKKSDKGNVILGYNLANKQLFSKEININNKILVDGKKYHVVGIIERIGDPGTDGGIFFIEQDLRNLLNNTNEYGMIIAQASLEKNPRTVADAIKRAMLKDRHQKEGKEDFEIQTSEEILKQLQTVLQIVSAVLIGIAAISLLVGGVGIMNTMYTAVLERTREIGIMKAIGARNADIMSIFLIESGLLGMTGGCVGVIIGTMMSKGVQLVAAQLWGPNLLQASIPWYLVAGSLLFSFLVGSLSGVLPARQAARMRPCQALQYE